jgi:glucosamine kinase
MPEQGPVSDNSYFLGFDGGGAKTECVLTNSEGAILVRVTTGPSNPLRTGYMRAWFSLSEATDSVLARQKIKAGDISGVCAGLGGAGRPGVAKRITTFFDRSFPNAHVRVTTDLEIALEAGFGAGDGIVLLAGTGSAAFGRDSNGRTSRVGGRGPWFSDEGSAFDIGRRAFASVARAEERRAPETALSARLFPWHQARSWDSLLERVSKNPDDVFPQTFALVAQLADKGDAVCQEILSAAASSLAELALCVLTDLGWGQKESRIAKVGGVHGRSKYLDAAIEAGLKKVAPLARLVTPETSPADAAARMAIRSSRAKGNAA